MARRRCGVGCLLARAARARGEGSRSDTEAWRDEANELKETLGFDFTECVLSIHSMSKAGLETLNLIHDDDVSPARAR